MSKTTFQTVKALQPHLHKAISVLDGIVAIPVINEVWSKCTLLTNVETAFNKDKEQLLILQMDNTHQIVFNMITLTVDDYEMDSYPSVISYHLNNFRGFVPHIDN